MRSDQSAFRRAIVEGEPFVGRAVVEAGHLTRHDLGARFERVRPRIYRARGAEWTPRRELRAVQLWAGERGVTGGWSAALLHGERWFAPRRPAEIAVPRTVRVRSHPGVVVRYREIPAEDRVVLAGAVVTDPTRTAIDVVRRLRGESAVMALDSLVGSTGTTLEEIERRLYRYPGMHGRQRVLDALARADPGAQSPPETRLRLLVHEAGHRGFRTQVPVYDASGARLLTADLADPRRRIALEYDGEHHLLREQRDWDSTVVLRAMRAGWVVIRVTAGMLDSPALLLARLRELDSREG